MGKIIIITFAFMAFAFYELSGGDEFVPVAQEKRAALEVERKAEETRLAQAKAKREAERASTQTAEASVPSSQIVLASATSESAQVLAAVSAALEADKAETVAPAVQIAEPVAEPQTDIREVTAARVNMRNGPGQSFNVVTKLNGGDAVEILQDPGSGWVKLRVVDSGRVGWMADFLLTAANN